MWIEENDIDEIFFVSDSPVSQYRNGKMVYLIRQYAMEKKKKIQWLYTESGHGNWFLKLRCDIAMAFPFPELHNNNNIALRFILIFNTAFL